ncbi:MAG: hypothetical protein OXT67_01535, partial [Zetaproteobacteria bacterium]|nr:hypothetical protein [Zetaproteobacteria bacterium]
VENGDQGHIFDWIDKILVDNPQLVQDLIEIAKSEQNSDRKEVMDMVLEDHRVGSDENRSLKT